MNNQIYHISNGDALSERLKGLNVDGEIITMRECMIDGPKDSSKGFETFFKAREEFIYEQFGRELSYDEYVVSQIEKMKEIPDDSVLYFWFEDDLFCQANWWFLLHYLKSLDAKKYLIRSGNQSPYSFAHLSNEQLLNRVEAKIELNEQELIELWECYSSNEEEGFIRLKDKLNHKYPFINEAFQAHIGRIPNDNSLGKPKEILKSLIVIIGSKDFGVLYRAFQKKAAIYGYGDLQVQQMLEELEKE